MNTMIALCAHYRTDYYPNLHKHIRIVLCVCLSAVPHCLDELLLMPVRGARTFASFSLSHGTPHKNHHHRHHTHTHKKRMKAMIIISM